MLWVNDVLERGVIVEAVADDFQPLLPSAESSLERHTLISKKRQESSSIEVVMAEQRRGEDIDGSKTLKSHKITTSDVHDDGGFQRSGSYGGGRRNRNQQALVFNSSGGRRMFFDPHSAYFQLLLLVVVAMEVVVFSGSYFRLRRFLSSYTVVTAKQNDGDVSYMVGNPSVFPLVMVMMVGNVIAVTTLMYLTGGIENVENQDFGRDTNRLDYFRVAPFDVRYHSESEGSASYGGGGGNLDNRAGGVTSFADDHGDEAISGTDGGEVVVQRFEQDPVSAGDGASERTTGGAEEQVAGSSLRPPPWWKRWSLMFTNKLYIHGLCFVFLFYVFLFLF